MKNDQLIFEGFLPPGQYGSPEMASAIMQQTLPDLKSEVVHVSDEQLALAIDTHSETSRRKVGFHDSRYPVTVRRRILGPRR
jgi:hypothetical protein